jgi:hypothetical protein
LGAPPEFARNLVQGKSDIGDPRYTEYLDILSVQVPGHEVSVEIVRDCPRLRSPADLQ